MSPSGMGGVPSRHGSQPAEVWIGGAEALILEAVERRPAQHVWIVTDRAVRRLGVVDRVASRLRADGRDVEVHDDVPEGPTDLDCKRAAREAASFWPDVVVAIGGGSVLDTAKMATRLATRGGTVESWRGWNLVQAPWPRLIAVPTTAGTGSEVQSFAVIARKADGVKMACGGPDLMPEVAILDARLQSTVPPSVAARAGLDALAHAVETMVTTVGTPRSRARAGIAFKMLAKHLPDVVREPDVASHKTMMLTAPTMAGQAIEASMLGAAHAMANPLSARFGIPHGEAVALMLPWVVRHNAADAGAHARYVDLANAAGLSPDPMALADWIASLTAQALPGSSLAGWGVTTFDADALGADAAEQWTGRFNPRPLDAAGFAALYRQALTGS